MKKRYKGNGGFLTAWCINLIFDLEWTVPAWIALALHFFLDISILWFVGAIALWIAGVGIKTAVFSWLIREGNRPDPPKKNKNPYSSSNSNFIGGDNSGKN